MKKEQTDTHTVEIFMAGDYLSACRVCRRYCMDVGLCVTVVPTTYIYTGGEEAGFIVGLRNYPRFPSTPQQIENHAATLADKLRDDLSQHSYMLVGPVASSWITVREQP